MKHMKINRITVLFLALFSIGMISASAQDSTKADITIALRYFNFNNKVPYLQVESKSKVKKKFQPVKGVEIKLYLDSVADDHAIAKVVTDEQGKAMAPIPSSLKTLWEASPNHTFTAVSTPIDTFDEGSDEIEIAKAMISLDTFTEDEVKNLRITVKAWDGTAWTPVPGVELKAGIRRLGGILNIGSEDSYTTDSIGQVIAAFGLDSLPGEDAGNLVLVASVEDNDQYGNLIAEKTVPWGVSVRPGIDFNKRTLFATRNRAPIWLLFMAYSVTLSVWGVLLYLVFLLRKILIAGKKAI